jgi:hypothetical protein
MTTALISFPLTYPSLDEIRLPQLMGPRNPIFFQFQENFGKNENVVGTGQLKEKMDLFFTI